MMRPPTCPTHDRLVLDLALGRLDDRDAASAETARTTCDACRQWWIATFESDAAHAVDAAVAAGLRTVELPRRRASWLWLAAAAAVLVAVVSLALLPSPVTGPQQRPQAAAVTPAPAADDDVLLTITFEPAPGHMAVNAPLVTDSKDLSIDGFESGQLGNGWSFGT